MLIDTAGRSPRDPVARELFACLTDRSDVRIHLFSTPVSLLASCRASSISIATSTPTASVVTKVDQIEWLGPLLGLLGDVRIPLSYLAEGSVSQRTWRRGRLVSSQSLFWVKDPGAP